MSIYGGFATRQQENTYNNLVKMLIELLSIRTLRSFDGVEHTNEEDVLWKKRIIAIHKKMAYMEQNKYLKPHLSYCFDRLAIKIREEIDDDQSVAYIKSNYASDEDFQNKYSSPSRIKDASAVNKSFPNSLEAKKRVQSQPASGMNKKKIPPLPNINKFNLQEIIENREQNNQTSPCVKSVKKKNLKHIKIDVNEFKLKSSKKKKKTNKRSL